MRIHQLARGEAFASASGYTGPLPRCRNNTPSSVIVHPESTTSSTSKTGLDETFPNTWKAPSKLRSCCMLFCISFCGRVVRVLRTAATNGNPIFAASRSAKRETSSRRSIEGTAAIHSGAGSGFHFSRTSVAAASTNES